MRLYLTFKLFSILKKFYRNWKRDREYKKRIEELKKRDPFNYKNF